MDVGLNKCLFNLVGLKDNVRRSAYPILVWDVSISLSQMLSDLIATDLLLCYFSNVNPSVP